MAAQTRVRLLCGGGPHQEGPTERGQQESKKETYDGVAGEGDAATMGHEQGLRPVCTLWLTGASGGEGPHQVGGHLVRSTGVREGCVMEMRLNDKVVQKTELAKMIWKVSILINHHL